MRLHLYVFILASGGIAFAAAGNAQQPMPMPAPLPPQPVITLTATASSQLANDRMHAFLRVDVDNPDPVTAGSEVNTRMAKALARAKAVRGVEAATTAYSSYQVSERNQPLRWRVSQTLSLESSDFTALAALVSKIQSEDGLVLGGMTFSVSPSARRTAEDALTQQAIKAGQKRRQCLSRSGRRGDERVLSVVNSRPAEPLRLGGRRKSLVEPLTNQRVEILKRHLLSGLETPMAACCTQPIVYRIARCLTDGKVP